MESKALEELLTREKIRYVKTTPSWQIGVDEASEPLLKDQSIEKSYVTAMKQNVLVNGPYMVLTDYFALMHATPGEGVNQLSMSLLISDEEVLMEGVPVKLFLVLAAKDSETHIEALSQITSILMDESNFKIFLSGNISKILELIKQTREEV